MKSYHKTISDEREKRARRSTRSRPRTPYLFIHLKTQQNGPFYIEFMDYIDTNLSKICPIMGDYLSRIYIQVEISFSPNIYQESITYIKIVSQKLMFIRFLKMKCPPACKSNVLHTSHLYSLPHKPSTKSNHA